MNRALYNDKSHTVFTISHEFDGFLNRSIDPIFW